MVRTLYKVKPRKTSRAEYPTHGSGVFLATAARTEDYSTQGQNRNCSSLPGISIRPNQFIGALSSGVLGQRSSENREVRCDSCGGRYRDD